MKQIMRNIRLQMIQLSRNRAILTYSSVVNIFNSHDDTCEPACMATSREKYYMEMYKTLTNNNDQNDASLSNDNIQEAIHKFIEEESDYNNVTVDNFSHTANTQRGNANAIFTSENLEKSDKMADKIKDLTINDAEHYVSNSAIANDKKCNPASDPKTATHTSESKGKVTDTSNRNTQQKLLNNRTLSFIVWTMNPMIDNRIGTIGGASKTLLTPATKEVIVETACGSACINSTPRHIS